MTTTSQTEFHAPEFSEYLMHEENENEIWYMTEALGDIGLNFPSGVEGLIEFVGSTEADPDLMDCVDTFAQQLEYAGKTLGRICSEYKMLMKKDKSRKWNMFKGTIQLKNGSKVPAEMYERGGLNYTEYLDSDGTQKVVCISSEFPGKE